VNCNEKEIISFSYCHMCSSCSVLCKYYVRFSKKMQYSVFSRITGRHSVYELHKCTLDCLNAGCRLA
jgi:hypothetical protein